MSDVIIEDRTDGMVTDSFGTTRWYKNGELHRENGPAYIDKNGTKVWYQNGLRHREDGPAVEFGNGYKEWHLNDIEYYEEEFNQWLAKKQLNEKLHTTLEEKSSHKRNKI